jgi:hypothetical protein
MGKRSKTMKTDKNTRRPWRVALQLLQADVLDFDFHRGAFVDLDAEEAI